MDLISEDFIIQGVIQAVHEAIKRDIKANAIVINDRLYFSKLFGDGAEVPMICGLRAFYSDELPNDTLFAVVQAHNLPLTKDETIAELEAENEMLKKKLASIEAILEGGAE